MKNHAISQLLRDKTGQSIVNFAKEHHVSRQIIYASIKGKGSRKIRIEIARQLQISPSIIWNQNPRNIKVVDDLAFIGAFE